MKLTTLKLGILTFGIFTCSQTMTAQEAQEKKKPNLEKMFKRFDANNDGAISLEEFKTKKRKHEVPVERLEKKYASIDTDANGAVTLEEFKAGFSKKGKGKKKK